MGIHSWQHPLRRVEPGVDRRHPSRNVPGAARPRRRVRWGRVAGGDGEDDLLAEQMNSSRRLLVVAAVVVSAWLGGVQAAQMPQMRDGRVFRSAVERTTITATVRDQDGRLVTGLPREAFEVY